MKSPSAARKLSFDLEEEGIVSQFLKDPVTFKEETQKVKSNKKPRSDLNGFCSTKKRGKTEKNRPSFCFHGNENDQVKAGGIVLMCYKDSEIYLLLAEKVDSTTGLRFWEDLGGKSEKNDKSIRLMQAREFSEETGGVFQSEDFLSSESSSSDEDNPYYNNSNPFAILEISDRHPTFDKKFEYRQTVNDIKKSFDFVKKMMMKNPKVDIYTRIMKYLVTFIAVDSDFMEKYPSELFGTKEVYEDIDRTLNWVSMTDFLNSISQGRVHTRLSYNFDLKIRDNFKSFVNCFSDKIWETTNNTLIDI